MSFFRNENGILKYHYDAEEVWLEPWGNNSFRVRATKNAEMLDTAWALNQKKMETESAIEIGEDHAEIRNGKIRAVITKYGKLTFYKRDGSVLLDEY